MDQRAVFDVVMQLQNSLPPLRENNRAIGAMNTLKQMLSVQEEPFIYSTDFTTAAAQSLAPGATGNVNINIQADADFRILAGAFAADLAGAAQVDSTRVLPLVTVLLTDTGSGRNFMDRPVPLTSLFGTGELPFPWPQPKIMRARSTLQVQAFNFSAATTYSFSLAFIGVKLYPLG
jgi:hypothetical protein